MKETKNPHAFELYGGQALWFPVLILTSFGLLFIYSASSVYSSQKYNNEYLFLMKQVQFLIPASLAAFMGMKFSLNILSRWIPFLFLGSLLATFLTHAPLIGKKVGGAARWLSIGGYQIQPSEFLKITTLMLLAKIISKHPQKIFYTWPILLSLGALLLQPDFGSTLILVIAFITLLYIHGLSLKVFVSGLALLIPLMIGIMMAAPYRVKRLITFLDPFADPLGAGFQVIQSFVGIATGGWFGKGIGGSQQKLFFLPEAHTDFILSVVAEEMGFVGIFVVSCIYLLLFLSLLTLLAKVENHFEKLLVAGFTAMLMASTLINMGVVAGAFPTKGLPLPFISSGGTALMANFYIMGILSQIHKRAYLSLAQKQTSQETIKV